MKILIEYESHPDLGGTQVVFNEQMQLVDPITILGKKIISVNLLDTNIVLELED
jgi:hypothetical protein